MPLSAADPAAWNWWRGKAGDQGVEGRLVPADPLCFYGLATGDYRLAAGNITYYTVDGEAKVAVAPLTDGLRAPGGPGSGRDWGLNIKEDTVWGFRPIPNAGYRLVTGAFLVFSFSCPPLWGTREEWGGGGGETAAPEPAHVIARRRLPRSVPRTAGRRQDWEYYSELSFCLRSTWKTGTTSRAGFDCGRSKRWCGPGCLATGGLGRGAGSSDWSSSPNIAQRRAKAAAHFRWWRSLLRRTRRNRRWRRLSRKKRKTLPTEEKPCREKGVVIMILQPPFSAVHPRPYPALPGGEAEERAPGCTAQSLFFRGRAHEALATPSVGRRLPWLRLVYLVLLVLALTRPQIAEETVVRQEGSISCWPWTSPPVCWRRILLSEGRKPPRGRTGVTAEFIAKRPHDRIGLVILPAARTSLPLTWDHNFSTVRLREVKTDDLRRHGHRVRVATAVNRLRE